MEIGSFIGLDVRNTGEYYSGNNDVARLNSARAGIYHACKLWKCKSIYIPYYLCPSVKNFLTKYDIEVKYYFINEEFSPLDIKQERDHAVLLVNYFGILSTDKMKSMVQPYSNVIIDNSAAFYSAPLEGCYNVYSPRKYFGVPDGCYVIGKNANTYTGEYQQDYSSSTASFLFKRIEFGTNETYADRMKNEERIDTSGAYKMSQLTRTLLSNIDYQAIKIKRYHNFCYAHKLYSELNTIDPMLQMDDACNPLIYPLVIERKDLTDKLKDKQIYTGRWWNSVLSDIKDNTFETMLSKFMVPVPIDQRYNKQELKYVYNILSDIINV